MQTRPTLDQAGTSGSNNGTHTPSGGVQSSNAPAQRVSDEMGSVILNVYSSLEDDGLQRALDSGATEEDPNELRAGEEHARAMAAEAYREEFDTTRPGDDLRAKDFERDGKELEEAEAAEKNAEREVENCEKEAARSQHGLQRPVTARIILILFALALAMTVSGTVHDILFGSLSRTDDILAWLAAVITALSFGLVMVLASLRYLGFTSSLLGVVFGIVICVGLGILRVTSAQNSSEVLLAVALTVIEVGIVLGIEYVARGLRSQHSEWSAREATASEANRLLGAATDRHARCKARVAELRTRRKEHIRYIDERSIRKYNIAHIQESAVKAFTNGYRAGIAKNAGRNRGVRR